MTGEPTLTAPKERNGAVCPSDINYCLKSEVSITLLCQLCSLYNRTVQKAPLHTKREKWRCAPQLYCINYRLKVKYPLRFVVNYVQATKIGTEQKIA